MDPHWQPLTGKETERDLPLDWDTVEKICGLKGSRAIWLVLAMHCLRKYNPIPSIACEGEKQQAGLTWGCEASQAALVGPIPDPSTTSCSCSLFPAPYSVVPERHQAHSRSLQICAFKFLVVQRSMCKLNCLRQVRRTRSHISYLSWDLVTTRGQAGGGPIIILVVSFGPAIPLLSKASISAIKGCGSLKFGKEVLTAGYT